MTNRRLTSKQREQQAILNDWSTSGFSRADYCREKGIKPQQLYNWKSSLKRKSTKAIPAKTNPKAQFLPLTIKPETELAQPHLSLWVEGVEIRLTQSTDYSLLRTVVSTLRVDR